MNSLFSHHSYDHRFRKLLGFKNKMGLATKLYKFSVIFLTTFFLGTFSYFYTYCLIPGQLSFFKAPVGENHLKILLWTKPGDRSLFYGIDEFLKENTHCPVKCEVTDDPKLVHVADAVAFAGEREYCPDDCQMPAQQKMNQLRVFFRMESPQTSKVRKLPNTYNWTMTYRRDSDVPIVYGAFRQKSNVTVTIEEVTNMASHSVNIDGSKFDQLKRVHLDSGKDKLIAWTVSHCETTSEREKLAEKLTQFLPVDIYGGCGPLKCDNKRMDSNWVSCYETLGQKYKFYLSFENSLCWDYATEKLFWPLAHGMVPIVYGGANYSAIAPPGSFIDAFAFESVRKLAEHIKFLDEHPEEYLKYFLWRDKYEIYMADDQNWWCELCKKLWNHSSVVQNEGHWANVIDPQYRKVNQDISEWWLSSPGNESSSSSPACRFPSTNYFQ